MTSPPSEHARGVEPLLCRIRELAARPGVFATVAVHDARLVCRARGSAAPAAYRIDCDGSTIWASLVMADRWLSESIESDLMHTGDSMDELLEEELVEQGIENATPKIEHFRSDDRLFTFRVRIPTDPGAADADALSARYLLALESCFRALGDMSEQAQP